MISDQMISSVIRGIDTKKFSAHAHGPGQAVNFNLKSKSAALRSDSLVDRLKPGNHLVTYYLKQLVKPIVVESIPFTWKEGTNNVSLEFSVTFQLKVNTNSIDECVAFVEALHHPQGVGFALNEIVDGCIDQALSEEYRRCQAPGLDLLSLFYKSGVLLHDSIDLDRKVSKLLQQRLGISHINIGLRLVDLPPQHLEVKCETPLDIRDVEERRYKVKTKADIELANYQLFRQQNFIARDNRLDDAIKASIEADIHRAVRKHVFDFGYFDLIESFYTSTVSHEQDAISKRIESDIKSMVANRGYEIKLFHTLCDIPPLILIDQGMRITLSAESHEFRTKDSSLPIFLNLTLSLYLKSFKKVKSLIKPEHDTRRIEHEITEQIYHGCKDVLAGVSIFEFDLAFDAVIRQKLVDRLQENLGHKYGFEFEIVTMQPVLSENKERLDALINEARDFTLSISPQANSGSCDKVEYQGTFIVTNMDSQGYHRFVSKDYGFCKTSTKRSESAYRRLADDICKKGGQTISIASPSFEREWKRHSIDAELEQIAKGISLNAEEYFSKEPEVATKTRNYKTSEQLRLITQDIGRQFAREEFGLEITVTRFKRLDTAIEVENQLVRDHKREMRQIYLENDKQTLLSQISSDAEYRKGAGELKSKALTQAIAAGEMSREDIAKEAQSSIGIDRDSLFREFDGEVTQSDNLLKNDQASMFSYKGRRQDIDHKKDGEMADISDADQKDEEHGA